MRFRLVAGLVTGLVACFSFPFVANAQESSPRVVKYHVTMDTVKYVYGTMPAVARLASGEILDADTVDAFGNAIQKPGDTLALVKGDNPLTGPF
jgi:hypothetical protein